MEAGRCFRAMASAMASSRPAFSARIRWACHSYFDSQKRALTRMARPRCSRRRASARPSSVRVSARGSAWSRSSGRWPWSSLVVVEAGLGELRLDGPADQIADEDTRGVGHLALLRDAGRVDGDLLQILRQRADEGHALDGQDLADLVHD